MVYLLITRRRSRPRPSCTFWPSDRDISAAKQQVNFVGGSLHSASKFSNSLSSGRSESPVSSSSESCRCCRCCRWHAFPHWNNTLKPQAVFADLKNDLTEPQDLLTDLHDLQHLTAYSEQWEVWVFKYTQFKSAPTRSDWYDREIWLKWFELTG